MDAISGALTSLHAAIEIAKVSFDAKVDSKTREKVAEMQMALAEALSSVVQARMDLQAARDAEHAATQKLLQYEQWADEKQRYQMLPLGPAGVVYALKASLKGDEPAHYLCANCYGSNRKSVIQPSSTATGTPHWTCPTCRTALPTGFRNHPPPVYADA